MSSTILELGLSNALLATILAIIAFAVTRRMRPQWALAVWLLVLAKLLMPPLWTAPLGSLRAFVPLEEAPDIAAWPEFVSWPAGDSIVLPSADDGLPVPEIVKAVPIAAAAVTEPNESHISLPRLVLLVWLTGTVLWSIIAARRIYRFNTLLRKTGLATTAAQAEVAALAGEMGLRRAPELRITHRRIAPLVWAFGRTRTILLPAALIETLSADERRALLLHELAHLRRRDHLTKFVELAAVAIYWWLPTAWWARRQADLATEGCCDAEVVAQLANGSRSYASALVKTIDFLSGPTAPLPLGASGFSQFRHVSRRIEMILQPAPVSRSLWRHRLALIALGIAVLPLSLSSLWAEPPAPAVESDAAVSPPGDENTTTAERVPDSLPVASDAERAVQQKADLAIDAEGPVEYEEDPKVKRIPANDAELPAALSLVADLANAQQAAEMNAFLKQYFAKKSLQESKAELTALEQKASEKWHQKMVAIRDQLRAHLATVEKRFAAGEMSVDELIEMQQRLADTEATLARAICPRTWSGEILRMQANYMIAGDALNRARRTWQQVYKQTRAGGAEPATEASAREHFYQCKQQFQNVMQATIGDFGQHVSQAGPDRDRELEQSAALGAEWRMFAIAGATTTGPKIGAIEPPSDEQVLEQLHRKLFADGHSAVRKSDIRLFKELSTTYADEPRTYAEVGEAQRHHAIYKCTVAYVEEGSKKRFDVFYIDHQHLHRFGDAGQHTRIDELEAQTKKFMFGEDSPTPPRPAAKARENDSAASEVPPTGGEFALSEDHGKDWNSSEGRSIDRLTFEANMKSRPKVINSQSAARHEPKAEDLFRAEMNRTVIVGPITSGDKPTLLDPPSDAEVLHALAIQVGGEHRSLPDKNRRIVKELVATYIDPPKWHPKLLDKAQLHHAHYKCTVFYDDPQGKRQEEVVYVDHNHLHQKTDSRAFDEFQSGPFHYTFARGIAKERVQARHFQLQLAREKAMLSDLQARQAKLVQAGPDAAPVPDTNPSRKQLEEEIAKLEWRIACRTEELEAAVRLLEKQAALEQSAEFFIGPER